MYISPVGNVVAAHNLRYHQYADDTQLYMAVRPSVDDIFKPVSRCVEDVARWFLKNGLLLNRNKTEAVLFGTKVQRANITTSSSISAIQRQRQAPWCQTGFSSDDGPACH